MQEWDEVRCLLVNRKKTVRMRLTIQNGQRIFRVFLCVWIIERIIRLLLAFVVLASTLYCHSLVIYSPLVYGSCRKSKRKNWKQNYMRPNWTELNSLSLTHTHIHTQHILHNAAAIHIGWCCLGSSVHVFYHEPNAAAANAWPKI